MNAMTVGLGALVVLCLLAVLALSRLFRKVEQGKALIVSKMRKVDVTFTGQVVLPVLHRAEVMDISVKTIEITRAKQGGADLPGQHPRGHPHLVLRQGQQDRRGRREGRPGGRHGAGQ